MESNLSYYKIFYTVAKIGNISKAAKELFISQPAISKAITKLEQNLETTLFNRNSRGVTLTFEGSLLYEQLKVAFGAIQNGETQVKNATELNMGQLRIGVSTTLCKFVLLPYLKRFILKYPYIRISIECQATYEILALLESGDIDIGLIAKPAVFKNVDYYTLGDIQDIFVASPTYLNRLKRESDLNQIELFEKATIMLLDKGNITRQHVDTYLAQQQIAIHNLIEVTSMDLLIDFAKIGIGIASVIKEFVKDELKNSSLIEIETNAIIPSREIGFACNSSIVKSKSLLFFLDMMK